MSPPKKSWSVHHLLSMPDGFAINFFTLKFKNPIEEKFKEYYYNSSLLYIRFAILCSIGFYSAFALLDYILIPDLFEKFAIIRFGLVIPFSILVVLFSFHSDFKKFAQPLLSFLIFLGGLGIIQMIYLSKAHDYSIVQFTYFAGLILVYIFGYNFLKIRFIYATIAGWSIVLFYELINIQELSLSNTFIINNNFFLISANLLGMFSAYLYEYEIRKNFVLQDMLSEEKTKVLAMNESLESKVHERTRELERAKERAENSDKLKSVFLANMSHEIRTPLNGILGFSEMLKNNNLEPEKKNTFLNIIIESGNNLTSVIDNLIHFSIIETGQMTRKDVEFDLKEMSEKLFSYFKHNYQAELEKKTISLIFQSTKSAKSIKLFSDPIKIEQILNQFFLNALKFTEKGTIRFGCNTTKNKVIFFMEDSGTGIDEKDKKLIFDRFFKSENTAEKFYGGAGIGLAIAKGLAEFLGGKIYFESKLGQGSVFYLELDISEHNRN